MGTWLNDDGLHIELGVTEATAGKGGHFSTLGALQVAEVVLGGADVPVADGVSDFHTIIPANSRIERVELISTTALTSGGSATLDVGLVDQDETTEIDYNGLATAVALATLNADGEINELIVGATGAGALVGTLTTNAGYITTKYNTAAFTGGVVKIRVMYSVE